ncbi:hypothetical protein FSP39_001562, partial [Pinctada imbricata]
NYFNTEEQSNISSDSDGEDQGKDNSSSIVEKLPNPLMNRVSHQEEGFIKSSDDKTAGSVFINPFKQAEKAKESVLEKHVKMVEKKFIKGKAGQVCFKFKRGKCPYGKSCKYSHDLSSELISTQPTKEDQEGQGSTRNLFDFHHPSMACQPLEPELEDDDSYMAQAKKKKRSGINDTLKPPKRAFQTLERQRESERPWTMKNMKKK